MDVKLPLYLFKFHYVSINSFTPPMILLAIHLFKFHYVSINSAVKRILLIYQEHLNSIMFLLIRVSSQLFKAFNDI